jgi:uncharacterized protein involved in exopolysaccharide biosynthesis
MMEDKEDRNVAVAPFSDLEVRPVTSVAWSSSPPAAGRSSAAKLLALLDLVAQQRKLLLTLVACGFLLSVAIAFLIPARYEAVTRLMPPDQSSGMGARMIGALTAKAGDAVGGLASDLLGAQNTTATLVGILSSNTVQDELINRFDLRAVYSKKKYEAAREVLTRRTDLLEDRRSGIITIRVQDANPRRAAALAQAYFDALNSRVSQLTTSSAHRERVFLEGRLQTVKQQLDEATLQLSRFSSKTKTFDPEIEGKAMLEAASNLQGQAIAAESELRGLEQIYGPENSRVRAGSAKLSELQSKLRRLNGSSLQDTVAHDQSEEPYPSIEQLPLLGNTYYDLARRAKIDEAIYEILTKEYELAKVEEAKEIPSIKVLDAPTVPESKSWPPRLFIVLFGTFVSIAVACLWVLGEAGYRSLDSNDPRRRLTNRLFGPVFRR